MVHSKSTLFIKPPDRYLENEFVYPQLGPHYLQSFLLEQGLRSDVLILYERRSERINFGHYNRTEFNLDELNALLLRQDGTIVDTTFDLSIVEGYDIVGMSVMTPQAPDAYLLNKAIKKRY